MKKSIIKYFFYLILLIIFFVSNFIYSQFKANLDDFNISIITENAIIEEFTIGSYSQYENDNYSIEIEKKDLSKKLELYNKSTVKDAHQLANSLEYYILEDGKGITNFKNSFYVISYDEVENVKFPVLLLVAKDELRNIVYEIVIYCYNLDTSGGIDILNSIKLID